MRGILALLVLAHWGTFAQTPRYSGSAACKTCHPAVYARWSKTRMANVVRDPKTHPDAIIPDLSKPDPLVNFTRDNIAFVYGSKWKQRYFTKRGDDYYPLGAQSDMTHQTWRSYHAPPGSDWWTAFYPDDNMQRPTGPLCDGCHSVNYDIKTKAVKEWNVGCEKCHGPGAAHVNRPSRTNIVNPARLGFVEANDVCIQCHSQGNRSRTPSKVSTTTGRLALKRARSSRISGSWKSISWANSRLLISPTALPTKIGCRATISLPARCIRTE
jgi:hypothetical protein